LLSVILLFWLIKGFLLDCWPIFVVGLLWFCLLYEILLWVSVFLQFVVFVTCGLILYLFCMCLCMSFFYNFFHVCFCCWFGVVLVVLFDLGSDKKDLLPFLCLWWFKFGIVVKSLANGDENQWCIETFLSLFWGLKKIWYMIRWDSFGIWNFIALCFCRNIKPWI